MSIDSGIPIIDRAWLQIDRTAIVDEAGVYTYQHLLSASEAIASQLLGDRSDLYEARVAFIVPPSFDYAAIQWGVWRAGGIAVPLCITHPVPELEYVINDSDAEFILVHPDFMKMLKPLAETSHRTLICSTDLYGNSKKASLPRLGIDRRAMILYTSGTTGKPKGVVTTHMNICAQITTLVDFWQWHEQDRILGVLPLHHIHGIINILSCALWSGACCELMPKFDAVKVWRRLIDRAYTLFMAVPTVYVKLIREWENADPHLKAEMAKACKKMRVMVSGSAALPVTLFNKWKAITGHIFLERYGMTEIGMGISNPINGERRPGFVGIALPGVNIRLMDESDHVIDDEGVPGEIQVQSPNVFKEYWKRPEETGKSFQNGWFLTGDTAVVEEGYYRILGRNSVDIIKTGGYKVSALEIEEVLRTHPDIKECAVVGVEDEEWGERVCVAVVLKTDKDLTPTELRNWAKQKIAIYKVPSRLRLVEDLPRNAMGKVTKPNVKNLFDVRI